MGQENMHTCANCGSSFNGKFCNECGEKKFEPEQLGVKHFLHQVVDVFTHFESKVIKTIWLNLTKPGFVTKENLNGVRVPYAKPVQMFIIVNLVFYVLVSFLHRTDYVPSAFDNDSSFISDRPLLHQAQPLDIAIKTGIEHLREKKLQQFQVSKEINLSYKIYRGLKIDSNITVPTGSDDADKTKVFLDDYDHKVSLFSKTLVFILIPVFALVFYLFFFKRLKYFGSALIFATHFLSYNLLFYSLLSVVSFLPSKWFGSTTFSALPFKGVELLLYNKSLSPFSTAVFGLYQGFEALHVIFFGVWLYAAFRRLFNLAWWQNILVSYFLARVFYIVIFCLYKKFLIAFTLWSM